MAIIFLHIFCCEAQEHCLYRESIFTWRFWAPPKQNFRGLAVVQLVEAMGRKVAVSIPDGQNFSPKLFFRPHFGPGVDSLSSSKWCQEYFLGGKDGRCLRLETLPLSCADCLEIWKPQPSKTLRACSGLYRDSFYFHLPTTNFRWKFDELPRTLEIGTVFIANGLRAVKLRYNFIAGH